MEYTSETQDNHYQNPQTQQGMGGTHILLQWKESPLEIVLPRFSWNLYTIHKEGDIRIEISPKKTSSPPSTMSHGARVSEIWNVLLTVLLGASQELGSPEYLIKIRFSIEVVAQGSPEVFLCRVCLPPMCFGHSLSLSHSLQGTHTWSSSSSLS